VKLAAHQGRDHFTFDTDQVNVVEELHSPDYLHTAPGIADDLLWHNIH
jgi:hypothetical protein